MPGILPSHNDGDHEASGYVHLCVKVQYVNSYSFTQQRLLLMVFPGVAALKGEQADFLAEQDWPWGRF